MPICKVWDDMICDLVVWRLNCHFFVEPDKFTGLNYVIKWGHWNLVSLVSNVSCGSLSLAFIYNILHIHSKVFPYFVFYGLLTWFYIDD